MENESFLLLLWKRQGVSIQYNKRKKAGVHLPMTRLATEDVATNALDLWTRPNPLRCSRCWVEIIDCSR